MERDLAPLPVTNRGFGGSQLSDSARYAERIVTPYRPDIVVLYAGDNDLADGKTAEQVAADFREFVAKVHRALSQTRIVYITIKPSPSRRHLIDEMRRANQLIHEITVADERLFYIDVFPAMMNEQGAPRPELFVEDDLHLNRRGYDLWIEIIKPRLLKLWVESG
jgi:lysophospholipase L1-like esterase